MRAEAVALLQEQAQPHREEAVAMLQGQAQSNREEASIALRYVNNLTENTLNRLHKQSQELQQMAANDERTRQMITARKDQLRNQEKEQESPDRAKPKAKSEPFKPISTLGNVESPAVKDAPPQKQMLRTLYKKNQIKYKVKKTCDNLEPKHEPKGRRGRPANTY